MKLTSLNSGIRIRSIIAALGSVLVLQSGCLNRTSAISSAISNNGTQNVAEAETLSLVPGETFYRAININGPAMRLDNHAWEAGAAARNFVVSNVTAFANQSETLIPAVSNANRASMIRSSMFGSAVNANMSAVPNGSYVVYVYNWEDSTTQTFSLSLNGAQVVSNQFSGTTGSWRRMGPLAVNVTAGTLILQSSGGDFNFSGLEVYKKSMTATPTPVATATPNPTATPGTGNPASTAEPASYSGPIEITSGGTYTGNWKSMDNTTPAVKVSTSEPVIIQNCHIAGNADGIWSPWSKANITVRNCSFHGKAPTVIDRSRGRAISIPMYKNLVIENNFFENTGSVVATDLYSGNGTTETLIVRFNKVRNIDGRHNNGGRTFQNFVGSANYMQAEGNPRGGNISWNDVINNPNESSTEDLINFYQAGGRADSPFKVHDNFLRGSYPNPSSNPEATGSGVQIDGKDHNRTAYIDVYNNTVMDTLNGGMGMAAGSNVHMHHNRIISSGKFPNGSWMPGNFAGVWIFDFYGAEAAGTMHDNHIDNNVIGWANPNYTMPYANRLDWYSNLGGGIANNTQLPNAPITLQMEDAEYQTFLQKVQSSGIRIGPQQP